MGVIEARNVGCSAKLSILKNIYDILGVKLQGEAIKTSPCKMTGYKKYLLLPFSIITNESC